MSSRLWVWSAAVLVCTAAPASAQPPSPLELAPGIRDAGFPDLALEYLKEIETKLNAADKALLPLERAKCLLEAADDEPDEGTRTSMINEAKVAFDAFIAKNGNHPRTPEAFMALAKLISIEAKAQLNRARRMDIPSEEGPARDQAVTKQKQEMMKAQPLFLDASKRFASAAALMKERLTAMGANDPGRAGLAREMFDADLAAAINEYNLSETFPTDNAADKLKRDDFLEKSRKRFEDLAKGPPTSRTVWIGKAWMAEVLADQNKREEAKTEFTAILNAPRAEAEEGKRLVRFFQIRRDYIEALTTGDVAKLGGIESQLRVWLGRYGNTPKPPPEVIASRYYLAISLQRQGINLMPKTPGGALPEGARSKFAEAEKIYRNLSQFDHDYTDRSAKNRMFVVRRLLGEADQPVNTFTTFENAQMAGLIQIAKMNDSETILNTAKFGEEGLDEAPFFAGCRGRLNLLRLEDDVHDRKIRVIALLERARELATDKDVPADVTDNLLRLVYFYQNTDQPHQAAILGEHIARTIKTTGGKGALAGLMALNGYQTATNKINSSVPEGGDADAIGAAVVAARKADRERAIACAAFMNEKFPNDTATDNARHRLAIMLNEEGRPGEAFDIITKIRPGYSNFMAARQYEGFLATMIINPKDKDGPGVSPERKKAVYQRAIGDLGGLGKPALTASKDDVKGFVGCRLRLAFLYLSQSRADEETEKTTPGYVRALGVADELIGLIPSFTISQDKGQPSLDGMELLYQAYDLRTRALYLRTKALVTDKKFDDANTLIETAKTEVAKPLFDAKMQKWFSTPGDAGDEEPIAKQKGQIASLASSVDRVRRDVVMVGFKIRCLQGNPKEAEAMLNLLKAAGGGIEANQAPLEGMARELAAHITELKKDATELEAAGKKPEAAAKRKEAADLGAGLAILLKEFTNLKDLPVPTILFLGQTFYTIGEWDNGITEFKKIKPPTEPDWDKKPLTDLAPEVRGKVSKEIALYRYAQLMIAKCLRGGLKFSEAEAMLQKAIGGYPPNAPNPGYASNSADFRKELATVYETRAAATTDPKGANAEWGKALKEWTTLYNYAKAGVQEALKPNTPPEKLKQAKSHFADTFFEIQRVVVAANTQLVKDPAKLAEKMDGTAKSILGLETSNKYNDLKMVEDAEGKKYSIKVGTELITNEVWNRYCDFLDKNSILKESYKKQGGKFFLERPKE